MKNFFGLFGRRQEPVLKYLAQVEGRRAGALPQMKKEEFETIRDAIQEIVQAFAPSGSNGKTNAMCQAIKQYFAGDPLREELYLTEVWIRGGRKAMDNYNGKQINSAL